MIDPVRRKLTVLFTLAALIFSLLVAFAVAYSSHQSLFKGQRNHLVRDIATEFLPLYHSGNLEDVRELNEADYFHVLNRRGEIVVTTINAQDFSPGYNPELARQALKGNLGMEQQVVKEQRYLIIYFHLDEYYVGRGAVSLNLLDEHTEELLMRGLIGVPLLVLLSLVLGWFLVRRALQPMDEGFSYLEYFSATAAHELMTPLTALRGSMEVVLRRQQSSAEYQETIKDNLRQTDRLLGILRNLNMMASSRFRLMDLETEPVDLLALVRHLLKEKAGDLAKKEIVLKKNIEEGLLISADLSAMEGAMENLMANAIKYSPQKGAIQLTGFRKGNQVVFEVANDTHHLKSGGMERLFQPLARGENLKDERGIPKPGKGLGLFLARYIIRSHRGKLKIRMKSDKFFARFTCPAFKIPL